MKKKLLLLILAGFTFGGYAQAPDWTWAKQSTGSDNEGTAAVATDSNGNVYAGGSIISANADLGFGPITNGGYANYFVVKYNSSGQPQWVNSAGGTGNEVVYGLATDSDNNVYALLDFQSQTVDFGGIQLTNTATVPESNGLLSNDVAVVKYDTNGNALWARKIGSPGQENSNGIRVDPSGNIYVSIMSYSNSLNSGTVTLTSSNSLQGTLIKLDNSGNTLWAKSFAEGDYFGNRITLPSFDASGNFYLAGSFASPTLTLGTTVLTNTEAYYRDGFVAKFDPSGNALWAKSFQGPSEETLGNATLAGSNLYVTYFSDSPIYHYGAFNYSNVEHDRGIFKLSLSGDIQSRDNIYLDCMLIADGTGLYVTANVSGPYSINGTTYNDANDNFIIAHRSSGGVYDWVKNVGSTGIDYTYDCAKTASGDLVFGGYFNSPTVSFGNTTLANSSNSPFNDMFVAKLASGTLATLDFESRNTMVYPNPTKDFIHIDIVQEVQSVSISDVGGRILDTQFSDTVDVSKFSPGIYILSISTDQGRIVQKIIKK